MKPKHLKSIDFNPLVGLKSYKNFALLFLINFIFFSFNQEAFSQIVNSDLPETETHESTAKGDIRQVDLILDDSEESQSVTVKVVDGLVFLDGDMLLGTEAEVFGSAAIYNVAANVWPNSTMPYTIKAGYTQAEEDMISYAINHVSENSNLCLKPRTTEANYVEFNKDNGGCFSSVGMTGGKQIINVSINCGIGATIHEILHAAGHWHEQSRADRDTYVSIDLSQVPTGNQHNFNKYSTGADIGAYDYGSIMHYNETAFTTDGSNSITVIKPPGTNNTDIGQRLNMSAGDIAAINQVYTSTPSCTPVTGLPSNLRIDDKGSISVDPTTGMVTITGVVIKNIGNAASAATSLYLVRSNGSNIVFNPISIPVLAADATQNIATISYNASVLSNGVYGFGLWIDPFNSSGDGNSSDNVHLWTFPTLTLPLCAIPTPSLGTITQPTTCISTDGSIQLTGLIANTGYDLYYQKNNVSILATPITTDGSGNYLISGLTIGDYTGINVDLTGCISANLSQTLSSPDIVPTFSLGTITNPTTCGFGNGSIQLTGLDASTNYDLNYVRDGVAYGPFAFSSDASGNYTASGMLAGAYTDITVTLGICPSLGISTTLTPNYTPPSTPNCENTTSSTGLNNYYGGLTSIKIGTETRTSGPTTEDQSTYGGNGFIDFTNDCTKNFALTEGATYTYELTTFYNNHNIKAWIDYNNNDDFDAGELIFNANTIGTYNSGNNMASGSFTVPTSTVNDTHLKLRVLCELGNVTNACYNPTYGQSENYPVFIESLASCPTASVISGDATICKGESTNLSVAITDGVSPYTVVYSDGSSNTTINGYTTGSNIPVSPMSTTTYTLVSVTDANSCTGVGNSGSAVVTVNEGSTAAVMSGTASICNGESTNISVAITGGTSPYTLVYTTIAGTTTINSYTSGTAIAVSPSADSTYTIVSVTDANGCVGVNNSGSAVITVNEGSTAAVMSGTTTICNGESTDISVAITGGTSPYTLVYTTIAGTTTINSYTSGTAIAVSPSADSTYTIASVTDANGCLGVNNSGNAVITVNEGSTAAVMSGTATICNGESTDISVAITGGTSPYTLVYHTIAGATTITSYTSGTAIAVSPPIDSSYSIVSVTDTNGCLGISNSGNAAITVNSGSTAATMSGTATITSGNSTPIAVAITGGSGPYSLVYSDGSTNTTIGSYASGTPISVSPTVNTTYTIVSVTDSNGCPGVGNTGSAVITVNAPPSCPNTLNVTAVAHNQTYAAANTLTSSIVIPPTNTVTFNAGQSITLGVGFHAAPTSTHTFTAAISSCAVFQAPAVARNNNLSEDLAEQTGLTLYPNPARDYLTIDYQLDKFSTASIGLYDMTGKRVIDIVPAQSQAKGKYQHQLNLNELPEGMYFVLLQTEHEQISQKLIVVRQ